MIESAGPGGPKDHWDAVLALMELMAKQNDRNANKQVVIGLAIEWGTKKWEQSIFKSLSWVYKMNRAWWVAEGDCSGGAEAFQAWGDHTQSQEGVDRDGKKREHRQPAEAGLRAGKPGEAHPCRVPLFLAQLPGWARCRPLPDDTGSCVTAMPAHAAHQGQTKQLLFWSERCTNEVSGSGLYVTRE